MNAICGLKASTFRPTVLLKLDHENRRRAFQHWAPRTASDIILTQERTQVGRVLRTNFNHCTIHTLTALIMSINQSPLNCSSTDADTLLARSVTSLSRRDVAVTCSVTSSSASLSSSSRPASPAESRACVKMHSNDRWNSLQKLGLLSSGLALRGHNICKVLLDLQKQLRHITMKSCINIRRAVTGINIRLLTHLCCRLNNILWAVLRGLKWMHAWMYYSLTRRYFNNFSSTPSSFYIYVPVFVRADLVLSLWLSLKARSLSCGTSTF